MFWNSRMRIKNFMDNIKVFKEEAGERLDKFLSKKIQEYSRSHIQKLIEEGGVLVNGFKKDKKYILKENDEIAIFLKKSEEVSLEPDSSIKFKIVFEDKDFAVIDKPAGLVVHPSDTHKKGTLANGLLARWPQIRNVGEDPARPGIVHRLDKETSGLMIIAKTNEAFAWFKKQFQEKKVEKKYLTLVFGRLKEKEGVISAPIARAGDRQVAIGKGRVSKKVKKTREAETEFKVKKFFDEFSLIEAYPKTGRMHQIRVHFASLGHPVVGDKKYASKKTFQKMPFHRQFLHSAEISFFSQNGEKMSFSSAIPDDLVEMLKTLEK